MSLYRFEEWLEKKHPEHSELMDEFTQDMNVEHEENQKLWGEYLEKYGREETCPHCNNAIFYILPESWSIPQLYDMTMSESLLSIPCLHCPTSLTITNNKGKLEQEFFNHSSETSASDEKC